MIRFYSFLQSAVITLPVPDRPHDPYEGVVPPCPGLVILVVHLSPEVTHHVHVLVLGHVLLGERFLS